MTPDTHLRHLAIAAANAAQDTFERVDLPPPSASRGAYLRAVAPGAHSGAPFSVGPVIPTLKMPEVLVSLTVEPPPALAIDIPATYHPGVTSDPTFAWEQARDAAEQACLQLREQLQAEKDDRLRLEQEQTRLRALLKSTEEEVDQSHGIIGVLRNAGVPTLLNCPLCLAQHIDEGEWATRAHRTHACQQCGETWRPYPVATYGVAPPQPEQGLSWEEWAVLTAFRETKGGPALRLLKEGTTDVVELLSLNFDRFLGHLETIRDEARRAAMIERMDIAMLEQGGVYLQTDG